VSTEAQKIVADGRAAGAAPPRKRRRRNWASEGWVITLASLVVLLLGLEALLRYMEIPAYVIPRPSDVFRSLYNGFVPGHPGSQGYYVHIWVTLVEAIASFVIGAAIGIVTGSIMSEFSIVKRLLLPYMVGLQSVPKIALAPMLVVWFGFGISSKIVLGVLLTTFPLLINTMAGLASVEKERIELMQSLRAGPWKTFRFVKMPSALPYIFAGLEMAAAYSVLGAVVGEFVGGQFGLGVLILNRNASLDISGAFAALILLALLGIGFQRTIAVLRRRLLFWAPSPDLTR
jgi:NitT/TauT family transport system permease protein